jgi:drug/metabolite transporter (DMT)-like permease
MTRQVLVGGVLGVLGIVLIYGAEFAKLAGDERTLIGATLTVLSVLASCCGSLVATHNQKHNLPIWQTMAYGMAYGGLLSLAIGLAMGGEIVWDARPAYLASLVYLALFGSVLAFGGYLYLMSHIGAARASYIGVMVPVVALMISSAFEDFTWQTSTFAGVAISVAGNIIILRKKTAV